MINFGTKRWQDFLWRLSGELGERVTLAYDPGTSRYWLELEGAENRERKAAEEAVDRAWERNREAD